MRRDRARAAGRRRAPCRRRAAAARCSPPPRPVRRAGRTRPGLRPDPARLCGACVSSWCRGVCCECPRRAGRVALGQARNSDTRAHGHEIVTGWSREDHLDAGAASKDDLRDGGTGKGAALVEGESCSAAAPNRAGRDERGGRRDPPRSPLALDASLAPFAIRLSVVSSPFGFLLASEPPPRRVGAIVALAAVAL